MSEPVLFESLLKTEDFEGYEDAEKYKTFLPKLEAYRQKLKDGILKEYTVDLPKPIEELIDEQFNAKKFLYESNVLTKKELEITDSKGTKIVKEIANGNWSSVEVFKAFAHRAIIAHQLTNCALDLFIDEGLKRAQELDDYYAKHGKTIGPLHGLPVSLKEHYDFKGRVTHGCYVQFIDNIPKEHGATIQVLENLGAVFFIRTSQPQTLMHLCGNNNFNGTTRCPYNLLLSSGGSSSGEGALVTLGGSVFGIGSDIGGSIRSPAAFSGCIGFRPSNYRVSIKGCVGAGAGQESVVVVFGPLARSVDDVELMMKNYVNEGKPWDLDQAMPRLLWKDVSKPKPEDLTVAVIRDDGLVRVSPPVRRGIEETVKKLKAAGVKVIEFTPPHTKLAYDTINKMYASDGNKNQRDFLRESGEPLTKLSKWCLNYGEGKRHLSSAENRKLNYDRDFLRNEYHDFFVKNKVDLILTPAYNNVAPHQEEVYNWSYTSLYNVLDLPTLAFQTGLFQDPKIDVWTEDDKKYEYRSDLERLENENYKPDEFIGAPIGLQLSARRFHDEELIAASKTIIDDILKVDLLRP
ncbi:uncharacterized protein KGF55_005120 [Candida pseudojiufengensis]|uniref:uncharacterized protein n=1 Tax=Candida pseudojiufengensis TaxID=497109 RepID=UPI002224A225|nr:uncharacterized protein KGF55_005120 [Candida pseudojiufengensis]KAI5959888.1 hypothetical protein KGF55_005120 [Candida pseudojiufengensis]